MSVLMTLRVSAAGERLEEAVKANPALLTGIIEKAKAHGVISHRFWASADMVLVVDEWPTQEACEAFFAAAPEIKDVMAHAGAEAPPHIEFWQKLDTGDDV